MCTNLVASLTSVNEREAQQVQCCSAHYVTCFAQALHQNFSSATQRCKQLILRCIVKYLEHHKHACAYICREKVH